MAAEGPALADLLDGVGAEIEEVAERLLRYEQGVIARFALQGGQGAGSDLQSIDLSIQILQDLRALLGNLAGATRTGRPVEEADLRDALTLERSQVRFLRGGPEGGGGQSVELF